MGGVLFTPTSLDHTTSPLMSATRRGQYSTQLVFYAWAVEIQHLALHHKELYLWNPGTVLNSYRNNFLNAYADQKQFNYGCLGLIINLRIYKARSL